MEVTEYRATKEYPTPLAIAFTPLLSYIASLVFTVYSYRSLVDRFNSPVAPFFLSVLVIAAGSVPFLVSLLLIQ